MTTSILFGGQLFNGTSGGKRVKERTNEERKDRENKSGKVNERDTINTFVLHRKKQRNYIFCHEHFISVEKSKLAINELT